MARSPAHASLLAVNSGSSSVKFALFTAEPRPSQLGRGTIDATPRHTLAERRTARVQPDLLERPLAAIGHRIVHGGPDHFDPQIVTSATIEALRQLVPFAPNHLPDEIALLEASARLRPDVPQIVCFDTAFHRNLPNVARRLPIPESYDAAGIRRYGFHGLSYTFLTEELGRIAGPRAAEGKVVMAHLGNGSSLAALHGGNCIDTSMGFTPIGGVVMSTRSGDIDPGVVTHILRTTGLAADEIEDILSRRSGLAGISHGSGDMRELLARESEDPACRLAVSIYCYEIRKRVGSYAAALGGIETLVFSGGIGEHAPSVRSRISERLAFLGVEIDEPRNAASAPVISTAASAVTVRVIPTNEEIVIARSAYRLLHQKI
jgi:acetate kinase